MSSSLTRGESFGLTGGGTLVGESPRARRAARDRRAQESGEYRRALLEADAMCTDAWAGDRYAMLQVNEAITTSDLFKSATGEVLDTMTLAQYADIETQWTKIAARTTVPNFKPKRLLDFTGNRAGLPVVPEKTDYPTADAEMAERFISVAKFGQQYGYTFEARINDEFGELQQVPNGWATQARYTEDDAVLAQFADPTTGTLNPSFFNAGNSNIATGTGRALTQDNVQLAVTAASTKRQKDGRLLRPGPLQLVVGPAQQLNAEKILNTTDLRTVDGAGNSVTQPNPLRGKVTLNVMANLPGLAWAVIPTPQAPRPAFYAAFLTGYETPDVRWKNDQGSRLGGGSVPAGDGSFDNDTIWYRVRHITGGAQGDPMFTFAGNGATS